MSGLRRRPEDEKIIDHIRRRIRNRRHVLGLTLAQVGERLGQRATQAAKYESGENGVSASKLWALAKALEVEPGWFFEGLER